MKSQPKTLLLLCSLIAAQPAFADESLLRLAQLEREIERHVERNVERHVERSLAPLAWAFGEGAMGFAGRELEGERVVKGAPYCATAVHETVQPLGDGNRIVKRQSTQLCRDGEGRTRRELQREGGSRVVYLHDPVAKESWVLNPEQKTARRIGGGPMVWHGSAAPQAEHHAAFAERMREQAERWREWAGQVAQRAREGEKEARKAAAEARRSADSARKGEPGVVVESEVTVRQPGASEPTKQREVRVIRLSDLPAMGAMPPMPPMPAMPAMPGVPAVPAVPRVALPGMELHFGHFMPRGEAATTALPSKEIEGIKVNGERNSWTIEAGKIGNEKPIVISREVWRSPELMLTVSSKDSDPRSGEVSYRLEKIKRGEPEATLMRVPADYQQQGPQPRAPRAPAAPTAPAAPGKA